MGYTIQTKEKNSKQASSFRVFFVHRVSLQSYFCTNCKIHFSLMKVVILVRHLASFFFFIINEMFGVFPRINLRKHNTLLSIKYCK